MERQGAYGQLRRDLRTVRDELPALQRQVGLPNLADTAWRVRLTHSVLPAVELDLPTLLVAITGGGSTGKSSLFNALAGAPLSQVAFRAGLTRRLLLAGHPDVLSGPDVARALLHRLPEAPVPWTAADDTGRPGPPLYVASPHVPRNLLLIDTPDFDTGIDGELVNRELAEPLLRTAEVLVYLFTNAVYNNLSNTSFMSGIVSGLGGRPTILVYRISRVADDETVMEHCRQVAQRLYGHSAHGPDGLPSEVIGVYRIHESDQVALGRERPRPIPVGKVTARKTLPDLLAGLDAAAIKRQVFAGDMLAIASGARSELGAVREQIARASLYRQALDHLVTQHALEALKMFPANEALALATRLFIESSPPVVRALRQTGRVVGAPLRGARTVARRVGEWLGLQEPPPPPPDLGAALRDDLLVSAGDLRNRLIEGDLIVQASPDDELVVATRRATGPGARVEALDRDILHVHVPAPELVKAHIPGLLAQDWDRARGLLESAAEGLVGMPWDIEAELRESIGEFRARMGVGRRLREAFFASLTALPPVLGVTYTLLTVNPAAGAGLWIQLEGILGINDLWALVSIPASAGLSEQDRRQLEEMLAPVFKVWLARRTDTIAALLRDTVYAPLAESLDRMPATDDSRLEALESALKRLSGGPA
ncbi:MAG: GTPase [Anaerolineae bacterium]